MSVADAVISFAGVIVAVLDSAKPLPEGWRELASPGRNPHWPTALEVCAPNRAQLELARFGERELELVGQRSDLKSLLDRACGLTAYLIQNGALLKDGSTFGISDTERIVVTLRESERFAGVPVIAASLR